MSKRTRGTAQVEDSIPAGVGVSHRHRHRLRLWASVAMVIAVGGTAVAWLSAAWVARSDADKVRQAFERSSADIASSLEQAIRDDESLAVNAGAFVLGNPDATIADLNQWLASVQAIERYPELDGLGRLIYVPAAEVGAYVDGLAPGGGELDITPPGVRPFYCFVEIGYLRDMSELSPWGFDFCARPSVTKSVLLARDSGKSSYGPVTIGDGSTRLGVQSPLFLGGVVPPTVEGRREAFVGALGLTMDQTLILDRALEGHPGVVVSLAHESQPAGSAFTSGHVPEGARPVVVALRDGWTVQTFRDEPAVVIMSDPRALGLLIAGVALSTLVAGFVFVLATGRSRALRLVGQRTEELQHQALHDALTGLPNRALIMDRIDHLLARSRRNGTDGAALFIDLDEFKNVNDTLGHAAGDRLLVAVAERLRSALRDADTIGRMGGDEFVVLVDGAEVDVAPEVVAARLLDVMRQPFDLDGAAGPLVVNASVGVAIGDREAAGDLLRDADVALYEAKAGGKNRYVVFHPEMQTEVSRRIELEFDLRAALQGDQFRLVYQPIYNLDDLSLVGVEALLRWDHPTLGTVGPDEFIPILEQTGQIQEVGQWVLQVACNQMAQWHARGDRLDLSVNVSGRQLDSGAVVDDIRTAVESSGLDAGSLIVEVTETALMRNAEDTAERLQAIKDLGVRIAVDDFGTGYSSLAYLQRFPVDCLKIDRMFTNAVTASPESKALISTLVQLGRDLGLKTLAEGVETIEEMDLLRREHVDEAQGFLLARPLDAAALETQLLAPGRPQPAEGAVG
jgi:diguanylate cyclase (GGDEF)-like protein